MIPIGSKAPTVELRTDESTLLCLDDFRGRTLALFLLGPRFSGLGERTLALLCETAEKFLALECSPVVLIGESAEALAEYRSVNDMPFLLLSDEDLKLHRIIGGEREQRIGACLIDSSGAVAELVPVLPPSELVRLTLDRVARSCPPQSGSSRDSIPGA
jgi:peroxiredoxin